MNGYRSVANFFISGAARQALQSTQEQRILFLLGYCSYHSSRSYVKDRSVPHPRVHSRAQEKIAPIKCDGKCPGLSIDRSSGAIPRSVPRRREDADVAVRQRFAKGPMQPSAEMQLAALFHSRDAHFEAVLECHFRCHFGRSPISSFYDERGEPASPTLPCHHCLRQGVHRPSDFIHPFN